MELSSTRRGHDRIGSLSTVLLTMVHIAPITSRVTAEDAARLFFERVYSAHGLPKEVVSNRGPQFAEHLWWQLCSCFSVRPVWSLTFHVQIDGQMERMNRMGEDTLCHLVGPRQDGWDHLLPFVEFAIGNSKAAAIGHTPIFLNYGRHPVFLSFLAFTGRSFGQIAIAPGHGCLTAGARLPSVGYSISGAPRGGFDRRQAVFGHSP